MSRYAIPYAHPEYPTPRPILLLWSVLEELQYPTLKLYWVGNPGKNEIGSRRTSFRYAYYIPAVINYLPGKQYRLAIDFVGANGKFAGGNRRRSFYCAHLGIEYLAIKRTDTRADMMTKIQATISQLRSATEAKWTEPK